MTRLNRNAALWPWRILLLSGLGFGSQSVAQTTKFEMGVTYECPGGSRFKVYSCQGPQTLDPCEVESVMAGQAPQRGQAPVQQILQLVPLCRAIPSGQAQSAPQGADVPAPAGPDANGFKIGEEVHAATAGGWYIARILQANGDRYQVRFDESAIVWKLYPMELRRIGPLNDVDRARGMFAMKEKVRVNVNGTWLDGEIIAELNLEYQVKIPGNRTVWAGAQHLQRR